VGFDTPGEGRDNDLYILNEKGERMKICIPSSGPELNDKVDDRFGRAPYFVFYDTESGKAESFRNPASEAQGGVGPKAAQFLLNHDIEVLITARVGGNALEALKAGGIKILLYEERGSSVQAAIDASLKGNLKEQ
jgi:predicted Fe-Mo cluster-binding NifX family protein